MFSKSLCQNTESNKVAELKISVHIACHSRISAIYHLGEIIHDVSEKGISIHRTQCSVLIRNALCPEMRSDLIMDLQDVPHSLFNFAHFPIS